MSLSKREEKILQLLPKGDRRVHISDLCKITGYSSRSVYSIIERLREKGVPIVSKRKGSGTGLFIATNEAQKREGIVAYSHQIQKMDKNKRAIEQTDVNQWETLLSTGEYKRLQEQDKEVKEIMIGDDLYTISLEVKQGRVIIHADENTIKALIDQHGIDDAESA